MQESRTRRNAPLVWSYFSALMDKHQARMSKQKVPQRFQPIWKHLLHIFKCLHSYSVLVCIIFSVSGSVSSSLFPVIQGASRFQVFWSQRNHDISFVISKKYLKCGPFPRKFLLKNFHIPSNPAIISSRFFKFL